MCSIILVLVFYARGNRVKTPEFISNTNPESIADKTKDLKKHYRRVKLSHKSFDSFKLEIPNITQEDPVMADVLDVDAGISQRLRAIVVSGENGNKKISGISDAIIVSNQDDIEPIAGTVITRHLPGGKAELVGFVNEDNKNMNEKSLKGHFSIVQTKAGPVIVADPHSPSSIEVFTLPVTDDVWIGVNVGKAIPVEPVGLIKNPEIWGLQSADAKELVESIAIQSPLFYDNARK